MFSPASSTRSAEVTGGGVVWIAKLSAVTRCCMRFMSSSTFASSAMMRSVFPGTSETPASIAFS